MLHPPQPHLVVLAQTRASPTPGTKRAQIKDPAGFGWLRKKHPSEVGEGTGGECGGVAARRGSGFWCNNTKKIEIIDADWK